MTLDLNNPFAQALISEGRKRGYGPMQIAASLGNAQVENGMRTNGTPGDDGTAFGGFQWRHERKAALDQTAAKMGLPWDNPMVQAAHWYNEQDGSESRWGLKNAGNLDQANRSVISALRPAGWTADNPMAGHAAQDRLSASSEAYRALTGGSGAFPVSSPPTDSPRNPRANVSADARADLPADGAQPVSFGGPQPQQATASGSGLPFSGLGDFGGGPGALFGHPQEGWNLGRALQGVSIAMMARDNPKAAEVLAEQANAERRAEQDRFQTTFDPKSGKLFRIDRKTGGVTTTQAGEASSQTYQQMAPNGELISYDDKGNITNRQKAYSPASESMSDGVRKTFQANNDAADTHYNAAAESQRFTKLLMDGKLDLSIMARMGNDFANYTGSSDEKTRNAAAFVAHLERLRNAGLLAAKGVQTEGDAERMMNTLLPGAAQYDNKAVGTLLRDITRDNAERYESAYRYNQPILKKYVDEDPAGYYQGRYADRGKQFRANEDHISAGWDSFLSSSGTPGIPMDGRDPIKRPRKPTFKEWVMERDKAPAPDPDAYKIDPPL